MNNSNVDFKSENHLIVYTETEVTVKLYDLLRYEKDSENLLGHCIFLELPQSRKISKEYRESTSSL